MYDACLVVSSELHGTNLLQELLACILYELQGLLATLVANGFAPLQQAYLQAWLHSNQQVWWTKLMSAPQLQSMSVYIYTVADMSSSTSLSPDKQCRLGSEYQHCLSKPVCPCCMIAHRKL